MVPELLILTRPTGLSYVDKSRERDGDYLRVAFMPFSTLALEWERVRVSAEMRAEIEADAAQLAARRGQEFQVSTCGQTVLLGGK